MVINNGISEDFPSGPVVKTPPSNAGGMGSILVGEQRSYLPWDLAKKKKIFFLK